MPSKYQQFAIVDRDGNPCPPGSEGEVTVGGPQVCLGTIQADGSFERIAGTRFRTGDLAVMDEEGFVRITGRTKDLIIRGGVNIAPLEIDHLLLQHPQVCEAAAVGVPDAIYGEEVVAYVVDEAGNGWIRPSSCLSIAAPRSATLRLLSTSFSLGRSRRMTGARLGARHCASNGSASMQSRC